MKFKALLTLVILTITTGCVAKNYQGSQTLGKTTIYCSSSGCQIFDRRLGSVRLELQK